MCCFGPGVRSQLGGRLLRMYGYGFLVEGEWGVSGELCVNETAPC